MKTRRADLRELGDSFDKLEHRLECGEEIEIVRGTRVTAQLLPVSDAVVFPDFIGRMRRIFGNTILTPPSAELLARERQRF
jgi:hypothetical protein